MNCVTNYDCTDLASPACMISSNQQILVSERSPSAFNNGICGCYADIDCGLRSGCFYKNESDPGVCGCTDMYCLTLGYKKCVLNKCLTNCLTSADCPFVTPLCVSGICECSADTCPKTLPICNSFSSICVICMRNEDCPDASSCIDGMCVNDPFSEIYAELNDLYSKNDTAFGFGLTGFILGIISLFFVVVLCVFIRKNKKNIKRRR